MAEARRLNPHFYEAIVARDRINALAEGSVDGNNLALIGNPIARLVLPPSACAKVFGPRFYLENEAAAAAAAAH